MNITRRVKYILLNSYSIVYGKLIGRSKKCVLFGSWMGEKFADNSRYLFQYVNNNKESLGLNHVIWATRDSQLCDELTELGYECVLIGTKKSRYWHCKSGIHFICDAQFDTDEFLGDIDSSFSAGAIKIQLWHGNGIKCVPAFGKRSRGIIQIIKDLSTQGLWYVGNYYFLCKSDLDFTFFNLKFGANASSCIDSAYPRTCECLQLFSKEQDVIEYINRFDKRILYLPTFRNNYNNYVHPLNNKRILDYLENNGILWIEKPHSADKNNSTVMSDISSEHVLCLDNTFDINVIYGNIDLLITDYSSAMLDALFYRIPIVYYVPDYDYYCNNDRGFLVEYDSVCITPKVNNTEELVLMIQKTISEFEYGEEAEMIRKQFWKHDKWSYSEIWESIQNKIGEDKK